MHKHRLKLSIDLQQPLQLPAFTDDCSISVRWVSYELISMIVHEGLTRSHKDVSELRSFVPTELGNTGTPTMGKWPLLRPLSLITYSGQLLYSQLQKV